MSGIIEGILSVVNIIGGLGVFIFGMRVLSNGLQKAAGEKLQGILNMMTGKPASAVGTGVLLTTMLQSSSATTVMVVSVVNAGILSLTGAIGVIMGANIGTTMTAWMVSAFGYSFKVQAFVLPFIALGLPLLILPKFKNKGLAEALIGFGLLFIGLDYLREFLATPGTRDFIQNFIAGVNLDHYLVRFPVFILMGTLLTFLVQSSSAAMAITLTLLTLGALDFEQAALIVLGENIGTTITAFLASLGANKNAKRAARVHIIFNVFGVLWMFFAFFGFIYLVRMIIPDLSISLLQERFISPLILDGARVPEILNMVPLSLEALEGQRAQLAPFFQDMDQLALAVDQIEKSLESTYRFQLSLFHTLFNIANVFILVWFIPLLEKASLWLVPGEDSDIETSLKVLSGGYQEAGEFYVFEARKYMEKMVDSISAMIRRFEGILLGSASSVPVFLEEQQEDEVKINGMEEQLSRFLGEVSGKELSVEHHKEVANMIRVVAELESMADDCINLSLLWKKKAKRKLTFENEIKTQLQDFLASIRESLEEIKPHLSQQSPQDNYNQIAQNIREAGAKAKKLHKGARLRLKAGANVRLELIFIDLVRTMEDMAEQTAEILETLNPESH